MNKLKAVFLVYVLINFAGCGCDDCTPPYQPPKLEPFYVNNSGVTVKLIAKDMSLSVEFPDNEQEIKNNDTLCSQHLDESCAVRFWSIRPGYEGGDIIHNYGDKPTYFKIEFFTEPKVCLVFDGDDKVENDIRYWENYTLIKKRSTIHFYSYTITPEHLAMASEEDCL